MSEEAKTLRFKFDRVYTECDKWPKSTLGSVVNIIGNGNMNQILKFESYGQIVFDSTDKQHTSPIFVYQNKMKNSAAVFNVLHDECNDDGLGNQVFDKCIIYLSIKSGSTDIANCGYTFFNTVTGQTANFPYLEGDLNYMINSMRHTLNNITTCQVMDRKLKEKRAKGEYIEPRPYYMWDHTLKNTELTEQA